jgi:hypothetical protein
MVLRSGTILHLGENMKAIGEMYYSDKSPASLERALALTVETKKELANARMRLDNDGFEDEIAILDRYIGILGGELALSDEKRNALVTDLSIPSPTPGRSLSVQYANLCREIALGFQKKRGGVVAVFDYSVQGANPLSIADQLSQMTVREIAGIPSIRVVSGATLSAALSQSGYAIGDLTDKRTAVAVGATVHADYVVTGTVMTMTDSVVVFSRVLNVTSAEVESAAQIILPRK